MDDLAAFAEGMDDLYPLFVRRHCVVDGAVEAWQGAIRPFGDWVGLDAIIQDLAEDSVVNVSRGGTLRHDRSCRIEHRPLLWRRDTGGVVPSPFLGTFSDTFLLRVLVFAPPRHPAVVSVLPEISSQRYRYQPHLGRLHLLREFKAEDTLCLYRPGTGEWSWGPGGLVRLLDFAAIWLAKHVVWLHTGGGARGKGLWIGAAASHQPADLLREIGPRAECFCGSGRPFGDCHRAWAALRAAS